MHVLSGAVDTRSQRGHWTALPRSPGGQATETFASNGSKAAFHGFFRVVARYLAYRKPDGRNRRRSALIHEAEVRKHGTTPVPHRVSEDRRRTLPATAGQRAPWPCAPLTEATSVRHNRPPPPCPLPEEAPPSRARRCRPSRCRRSRSATAWRSPCCGADRALLPRALEARRPTTRGRGSSGGARSCTWTSTRCAGPRGSRCPSFSRRRSPFSATSRRTCGSSSRARARSRASGSPSSSGAASAACPAAWSPRCRTRSRRGRCATRRSATPRACSSRSSWPGSTATSTAVRARRSCARSAPRCCVPRCGRSWPYGLYLLWRAPRVRGLVLAGFAALRVLWLAPESGGARATAAGHAPCPESAREQPGLRRRPGPRGARAVQPHAHAGLLGGARRARLRAAHPLAAAPRPARRRRPRARRADPRRRGRVHDRRRRLLGQHRYLVMPAAALGPSPA